MSSRNRGFTLVELLTVFAIIGILASIVFVSMKGARISANDAKRVADFDALAKGLEIVRAERGMYTCGVVKVGVWGEGLQGSPSHSPGSSDYSIFHTNVEEDVFLNGYNPPGYTFACQDADYGLYDEGILQGGISPPAALLCAGGYLYVTSPDREKYVLFTYLESDPERMKNDGGICDYFYEVGVGNDFATFGGISGPPKIGPISCAPCP